MRVLAKLLTGAVAVLVTAMPLALPASATTTPPLEPAAASAPVQPVLRYDYHRDRFDSYYSLKALKVVDHRTKWTILDACASTAGSFGHFERFHWHLKQLGRLDLRYTSTSCSMRVNLPPGRWGGTLSAHTSAGTDPSVRVAVAAQDLLIVSIGDSLASGEGNPDQPGNYLPVPRSSAVWGNSTCHRSALGGHAKAAETLSGDRHTGVIFVSMACTGADTSDIWYSRHNGQSPQLDDVRTAVCHFSCTRTIDLLEITVGVNNVGFADIVEYCSILRPVTSRDCNRVLNSAEARVDQIRTQLRQIKSSIAGRGLKVSDVVLTEYPANIFAGGCAMQSSRIAALATRLNRTLRQGAADNGWSFATGITTAFNGHSFCKSGPDSWFRSLSTSLDRQGDKLGTAHPTAPGHRAIAAAIVKTYRAAVASRCNPCFR